MDGEATGRQVKETKDKVRNSALFLINKGFELRLSCFDIQQLIEEVEQ